MEHYCHFSNDSTSILASYPAFVAGPFTATSTAESVAHWSPPGNTMYCLLPTFELGMRQLRSFFLHLCWSSVVGSSVWCMRLLSIAIDPLVECCPESSHHPNRLDGVLSRHVQQWLTCCSLPHGMPSYVLQSSSPVCEWSSLCIPYHNYREPHIQPVFSSLSGLEPLGGLVRSWWKWLSWKRCVYWIFYRSWRCPHSNLPHMGLSVPWWIQLVECRWGQGSNILKPLHQWK